MEAKVVQKQALLVDTGLCNKENWWMEKLDKKKRCQKQSEEWAANKQEKAYWKKVKHYGWGNKLYNFIRISAQNLDMTLQSPQNLAISNILDSTMELPCWEQNSRR